MVLNVDCVRDVLLCVENSQEVFVNDDGNVAKGTLWIDSVYDALPQYSKADIFYALYNLDQAGYVSIKVHWLAGCVNSCAINHMTYAGHEFLEKIRPETVWEKTTGIAGKVGSFSLKTLASIAEGVMTTYLSKMLGN